MLLLFYLTLISCQAENLSYFLLTPNQYIYGQDLTYIIKKEDTFVNLAIKFKIGYNSLILANSKINPWIPPKGKTIIIPKKVLIPKSFKKINKGIVINLPEMRLYFFYNSKKVFVYPISIGKKNKLIPTGIYKIIDKKKDPIWYPPPSIRKEKPYLPKKIPPGPNNPLGKYVLYLSKKYYAIHGTNILYSIGRRATHGCIRLYPFHIEELFHMVSINTPVWIVYEPYKIAIENNKIYIQCFPDIENRIKNPVFYTIKQIQKLAKGCSYKIELLKLIQLINKPDGLVHKIGYIIN